MPVASARGAVRDDEFVALPLLEELAAGFVKQRVELGRVHELFPPRHPDAPVPRESARQYAALPSLLHLVEGEVEEVRRRREVAERVRKLVRAEIHARSTTGPRDRAGLFGFAQAASTQRQSGRRAAAWSA